VDKEGREEGYGDGVRHVILFLFGQRCSGQQWDQVNESAD